MISAEQRETLKEIIGTNYSEKIQNYFEEKGIKNIDGSRVTKNMIRGVMGGQSHDRFEKGIFDFAQMKKEEQTKYESKKRKVLGIKKAGTAIPACK